MPLSPVARRRLAKYSGFLGFCRRRVNDVLEAENADLRERILHQQVRELLSS